MGDSVTQQAPLDVSHVGDGLLMGSIGPVCLAIWQTKPVRATFEIQRDKLAAVVAAQPGRALFLCVIEPTADPPDEAVRSASAKMITGHGRALAGSACVIEGSGFRASVTRAVLIGISLVMPSPVPSCFVDTVPAASFVRGA